MVKIVFTDDILWRFVHGTKILEDSNYHEPRAKAIHGYLKEHWSATIEYNHSLPVDDQRSLQFKDPKKATEFVLKYA